MWHLISAVKRLVIICKLRVCPDTLWQWYAFAETAAALPPHYET